MTYSLVEPIEKVMGWKFEGIEHMTGLPEYRNGESFGTIAHVLQEKPKRRPGGLLVDLGVLSLRTATIDASLYPDPTNGIPKLPPSHPAIIEWRAMTIIELCVLLLLRRY